MLGPSNHFTHDQTLEFDEEDSNRACGIVNTHAEVVRNNEPMLASVRYHDEYRLEQGRWRFHVRALAFFYYVRPSDYQQAMGSLLRNRAYAEPRAADFPESLGTWQSYYRERPRA